MTDQAVLTINQKIDAVNNFINAVIDPKNSYYCIVGKPDPWTDPETGEIDETSVLPANGSIAQIEQSVYQNMIYGKLLLESDINFMIKRYEWVSGTTYARYDHNDPNLYDKNFFVITDSLQVFKCIHNGYSPSFTNGIPSTVKPSVTDTTGTFQTSDGYIWKYMFTCETAAYSKFQTSGYIPVTPNTDVKDNAVPGTIDNIIIMNGGSRYEIFEEGFLTSFVNNYVVTLPPTSSPIDDYYKNSSIYLKSGFGAGQTRKITSYDGVSKQLSVNPAFSYYQNLNLDHTRIYGGVNFAIGDFVYQLVSKLTYVYKKGTFNIGDTVYQSDNPAFGEILHSNTIAFIIQNESDKEYPFKALHALPIYTTKDIPTTPNLGKVNVGAAYTSGFDNRIENSGVTIFANTFYVNNSSNTITYSGIDKIFNVGDVVYYTVPTDNTAIPGLTANTNYYISYISPTEFAVSLLSPIFGGTNANLQETRTSSSPEQHSFTSNVDFSTIYSLNDYIRIGSDYTKNIRRIIDVQKPKITRYNLTYTTTKTASFNGSSAVTLATDRIAISSNPFFVGDRVEYRSVTGTAITPLVNNGIYYVSARDSSYVALALTPEGANIDLTIVGSSDTGHSLRYVPFYVPANEAEHYSVKQGTSTGIIEFANSSFITIENDEGMVFTGSGTLSNASCTAINVTVTSATPLKLGSFMSVDESTPFSTAIVGASHYSVNNAATPESLLTHYTEASIVYNNLTSVEITYEDVTPLGSEFVIGETINVLDSNDISQNANGTLSFANSTFMIINNIQNTGGFLTDFYIKGGSTNTKARIASVESNPNITVYVDYGGFVIPDAADPVKNQFLHGTKIFVTKQDENRTPVGNAYILSTYTSPDDTTEYIISPTVNITGDGNGAMAYCSVDLSENNPSRAITSITMINHGQNYTKANVEIISGWGISSNGLDPTGHAAAYNNTAIVIPQISPIHGHGYSPTAELGASYCGISKEFKNAAQESYILPTYGSYRNISIIKNPLYEDVILNTSNFDRTVLYLRKPDYTEVSFNGASSVLANSYVYANTNKVESTANTFKVTSANSLFKIGDRVFYAVPTGGTPVSPLVGNTNYYVSFANLTDMAVSLTYDSVNKVPGANVNLQETRTANPAEVHKFTVNTDAIAVSSNPFKVGDRVLYKSTVGTAIGGLVNNANYYVNFSNATHLALSNSPPISGFANIVITTVGSGDTNHSLSYNPGTFEVGEIIIQPYTSAAGVVAVVNTSASTIELKNKKGTFLYNLANDNIYGLNNSYVANVSFANTQYFELPAALEGITDVTRGGTGSLNQYFNPEGDFDQTGVVTQVGTQKIRMTNVVGQFYVNDQICEPVTNTYAKIDSIYVANGSLDASANFGYSINQTARITLTSNQGIYELNEYVTQKTSWATGRIISTCDEVDIEYVEDNVAWSVGDTVKDTTTLGTGTIKYHDPVRKLLKLTNISKLSPYNETTFRPFQEGHIIKNAAETKTATINKLYAVIILDDVNYISGQQTTPYLGRFTIDDGSGGGAEGYAIIGNNSGASGLATRANSIKLPDMVRESGEIIYTRNLAKFDRTPISTEKIKLIIKF